MRGSFKAVLVVAALVLPLVPLGAGAQQQDPAQAGQRGIVRIGGASGMTAEDRANYCLWAGQLYSIGSSFCTRQQTMTTCTEIGTSRPPVWVNKDNDKNCDRNPSWTPQ
jgi:hypothetical protein